MYTVKPAVCPSLQGLLGDLAVKPKLAIRGVLGAVELSGPPPAAEPVLLLQLHVVDTAERSIDQRQLVLTLGDSTRIDLGSMGAYRLSMPGAKKVEQDLLARIPAMQFRALARAEEVTVALGNAMFNLSTEHLDALRALYAVAVCGGQSKS